MKTGLKIVGEVQKSRRDSGNYCYSVRCRCFCGAYRLVELASLKRGQKSCGCLKYRTGKDNPGWKGGKTLASGGYVVLNGQKIGGKYPSRKLEHRAVMEKSLGRELSPKESVHHKNGCRQDNRLSNLELWSSHHPHGQRVSDLLKWAKAIIKTYAPGWH